MFLFSILLGVFIMHYTVIVWTSANATAINLGARFLFLISLLLSVLFIGSMALSRVYDGSFAIAFRTAVYIWLGSLFLWFALVVCVALAQLILAVLKIKISFSLGLPLGEEKIAELLK
jgi:hypothetical protein